MPKLIRNLTGKAMPFEYAGHTRMFPAGVSEVPDDVALNAQFRLSPKDFQIVDPEAEAAHYEAEKRASEQRVAAQVAADKANAKADPDAEATREVIVKKGAVVHLEGIPVRLAHDARVIAHPSNLPLIAVDARVAAGVSAVNVATGGQAITPEGRLPETKTPDAPPHVQREDQVAASVPAPGSEAPAAGPSGIMPRPPTAVELKAASGKRLTQKEQASLRALQKKDAAAAAKAAKAVPPAPAPPEPPKPLARRKSPTSGR